MTLPEAVLLGIIQGLTEFLPVSSTAHLVLARKLLGHDAPDDAYTTVIQLGTLVAVFVYFRRDIGAILAALWLDLSENKIAARPASRLGWLVVVGTVPAVAVGLKYKKLLKATFYDLQSIALVAVGFAVLMGAAEVWVRWRHRAGTTGRGVAGIGWGDAVAVGLWQALALMPGASRSGTTITGGLFAGLGREAAARFSFLLSLPVMLGAGIKELYDEYKSYHESGGTAGLFADPDQAPALVAGLVVSGVVGYLSIAWLLHFLKRYSTWAFVGYRLVLGAVILGLLAAGVVGR